MNLRRGVGAALLDADPYPDTEPDAEPYPDADPYAEEDEEEEEERSCGQVTVADWKTMGWCAPSSGGAGETSRVPRYFSMRRRETKPW